MYLVLGDSSSDGHSQSDKILLKSNRSVADIQEAYKSSCKLTGVSFNHNQNYTGIVRSSNEESEYQIATEYERSGIPSKALEVLCKFGFRKKFIESNKYEFDELEETLKYGDDLVTVDSIQDFFVDVWIWFVKLSLKDTDVLEVVTEIDTIPHINGHWDKNLNVQFGYGLYYL